MKSFRFDSSWVISLGYSSFTVFFGAFNLVYPYMAVTVPAFA